MGNRNSQGNGPVDIPKHFRFQSTIGKVTYKEQSGTGAIYGFEFPKGTWRTLFIACNQVVRISEVKEVDGTWGPLLVGQGGHCPP